MIKLGRVIKRALLGIILLLIITIAVVAIFVWYNFFDVTGLVRYNGEPIKEILPYSNRLYLITEDGTGYVAGDYNSSSRKYRNSEFYIDEEIETPSPVRFFDGKIDKIIPYSSKGALFITDAGELYELYDFDTVKIYDNAVYGAAISRETFLAVESDGTLVLINKNGDSIPLIENIKQVESYIDRVFVLFTNGELCEIDISDVSHPYIKEVVYTNVSIFGIQNTSLRYNGEKYIYDDEDALNTPLMNVLTTDGNLYAKGAYSLLGCARNINVHPEPRLIEDWKLIGENITSFSLAPMGTVMLCNDKTAAYYGFDSDTSADSLFIFGSHAIPLTDVTDVRATNLHISIKTSNGFYVWGRHFIYDYNSEKHDIFTGEPIFIEP